MPRKVTWLGLAACGALSVAAAQTSGTALATQKVSELAGNFGGTLDDADHFGRSLAALGDLDGDGSRDLAVGTPDDDDGGTNRGAVWVLFLDETGSVRREAKISVLLGGFRGALQDQDRFGSSLAWIGDLDGDGIGELAVGAEGDDDGGTGRGAVWILFLERAGTVRAQQKISSSAGGFLGPLRNGDRFGRALAGLGDLDFDGVADLAVGADQDDDGGVNRGAVWILFLDPSGRVGSSVKISATQGGFAGALDDDDRFGCALARLPDIDGDVFPELAVGADQDDDLGSASGAVWVLFLDPTMVVRSATKISTGLALGAFDRLGSSLAAVGDLDGDRRSELAVGAIGDDDGGLNLGAAWILSLDPAGALVTSQKLSATAGGFPGPLTANDNFGIALAAVQDLDGNGVPDLAIGADQDDDGDTDAGAAWVVRLQGVAVPNPVVRNGLGVNRVLLTAERPPAIGQKWRVQVDCSGHRPSFVFHFGSDQPLGGTIVTGYGQWLVDFQHPRLFQRLAPHAGAPTTLTYSVPPDIGLIGMPFYSQAVVLGFPSFELTNALDGWATP